MSSDTGMLVPYIGALRFSSLVSYSCESDCRGCVESAALLVSFVLQWRERDRDSAYVSVTNTYLCGTVLLYTFFSVHSVVLRKKEKDVSTYVQFQKHAFPP